jgi:hypothetical protein
MQSPDDNKCAIWGTPADTGRQTPFIWQFNGDRTAGAYTIDILAFNRMSSDDAAFKARLTTWLIDQRRAGNQWPMITPEVLDRVWRQSSLRLSDRIERFFVLLSTLRVRPGSEFFILNQQPNSWFNLVAAWTESHSDADTLGLLGLLGSMGLIKSTSAGASSLTPDGFARLEAAEALGGISSQAFVAMWFGTEMDDAFQSSLPALPMRATYHFASTKRSI